MSPTFELLLSAATPWPVAEAVYSVQRALVEVGCVAEVTVDELPSPDLERIVVVVGPHEVYPHLPVDPEDLAESLSRTLVICTARPSALDWHRALPYAATAAAVFDVSDAGVAALAAAGVDAERFRLGYDSALDLGTGGLEDRPLDVLFVGTATPRRQRLLAEAARWLSRRDVELHLIDGVGSPADPVTGFVHGDEKYALFAQAKIALNVHPGEDPLFEWMRARDAISNGALFVSELSSGATPLDPGRHFVSVNHDHLGATLDRLLDDPERLDGIRLEGAAFFRDNVRLTDEVRALLAAAEAVPEAGRRVPSAVRPAPPDEPPDSEELADDAVLSAVTRQNAVLKRLFVEIRNLRRELAHVRHSVEDPGVPLVSSTCTPGWSARERSDVSVVVTLHNYGRYVREAVESALASTGVTIEVVVIDDRSTDDGREVVRSVMDERPDAAILLLEQRVNTGVQRARNAAFAHTRSPFAFVLDADNVVYPRGIAKLHSALLASPDAAFAYGIIERFDESGGLGLMGVEGWDESRLARSHYIDAMALVRVDAWQEVGGYVTDPALELGWEDYDLWLNFASHGYRGLHVPEIVARYRVHGISALAITTLDTAELIGRLQARHSRFFRRAGGGQGQP